MASNAYEKKIVRLLEALYQDTVSAVRADGGLSEWFDTVVGVMQGCVLSPQIRLANRRHCALYKFIY